MKVSQIVNTMTIYNDFNAKINECIKKKNDYDAWDDDDGVIRMENQIKNLKDELGRFLDTEV